MACIAASAKALTIDDLKEVRKVLYPAHYKWYDIGVELNLKVWQLDAIKSTHSDPKDCLTEMVKMWLTYNPLPTWKALEDVLRDQIINERELADQAGSCGLDGTGASTLSTTAEEQVDKAQSFVRECSSLGLRGSPLEYGLWDQIRVDHEREFNLILYIQEHLRHGRGDPSIFPYVQTTSTNNHIIERMWVELNHRVTYPIKRVVAYMDNQGIINMDSPSTKYSVSTILLCVCEVGMRRFIAAWNNHAIPNRGIPERLQQQRYHTATIHRSEVPELTAAVTMYNNQGGALTWPATFGVDPLSGNSVLIDERQERWSATCGMSVEDIFSNLVSGNSTPLENAITAFCNHY